MWWMWVCLILVLFYVYIRLSCGITRSATCLVGKTAIITGANSGLGYQTALNLASRGCKIIMADVVDMEESKRNIIKETNNSDIITKRLDLSSLRSVRDFAADINATVEKLDILINNAGVGAFKNNRTTDGLHPVMQINYFGHFLLTHLLVDLLKKSSPSRIVFTSSCMAFLHNLSINNLNLNEKRGTFWEKLSSYNNSKFALLVASDIFAEKLKGTGVSSNSIHPGIVTTDIYAKSLPVFDNKLISSFVRLYSKIYSKDVWEGSQVLVHVAVSKDLEDVTGKYFWDCKPFIKPPAAYNKEFCKSIWEASEKCVMLKQEEKI